MPERPESASGSEVRPHRLTRADDAFLGDEDGMAFLYARDARGGTTTYVDDDAS